MSTPNTTASATPPKVYLFACLAMLVLGAALRLSGLSGESFWFDEGYTLYFTDPQFGSLWDKVVFHAGHDPHPPLYFAFIDVWRDVSIAMPWLRLSSVLFMVGAMALLWRIGTLSATPLAALIAVTFFALSRTAFQYSLELRMYSLGCLFSAVSLLFFLRLMTSEAGYRKRDIAGLALGNGLLMLTHYTGAFLPMCEYGAVLLAPWVTVGYTRAKQRFVAVTVAMVGSAILFLPQVPWFLMQGSAVGEFYWIQVPSAGFFFITLHQLLMGRTTLLDSAGDIAKFALFGAALFAVAVYALYRIRDRRVWILFCCAFGPLVVSWVYSQVGSPVFLWRSFLYTLLPMSVLIGMATEFALTTVRKPAMPARVVSVGVLTVMAYVFAFNANGTYWDLNNHSRTEYDLVVSDVGANLTDSTLLVFTPNLIVGAFYYAARNNEAIVHAPRYEFPGAVSDYPLDGADPGFAVATDEEWARFEETIGGYDRVILVRRPPGEPPVNPELLDRIAQTHPNVERLNRYGGEVDVHIFDRAAATTAPNR